MPAVDTLKSSNVCANCKARKKRCDKSLPRCRYCAEYYVAAAPPVVIPADPPHVVVIYPVCIKPRIVVRDIH